MTTKCKHPTQLHSIDNPGTWFCADCGKENLPARRHPDDVTGNAAFVGALVVAIAAINPTRLAMIGAALIVAGCGLALKRAARR